MNLKSALAISFLLAAAASEAFAEIKQDRLSQIYRSTSTSQPMKQYLRRVIEKREANQNQIQGQSPLQGAAILPSAAPEADAAFKLGEVYSSPNPAVRGKKPVIHLECGIADSVDIRIYDVAGELVHEARIDAPPGVVGGKYAYEYAWDTSGAASGGYLCVLTAKKAGKQDLRAVRKLAVVK